MPLGGPTCNQLAKSLPSNSINNNYQPIRSENVSSNDANSHSIALQAGRVTYRNKKTEELRQ